MPHLRLVLGRHHGDLWWREMENEKIDIEELDSNDIMDTVEDLLKRRYQMEEGPLWFTRFVAMFSDDQHKDANHSHEFNYVCIFGFHHNVTDGTTNMKFCKVFLKVLNDMVQGKDVDVSVEGSFAYPLHDRLADIAATRRRLLEIFLSRFYKGMIRYGGFVKNFTRHYRMPTHTQASTRVLFHELDETSTEKLLQRCKVEEVTLNSTFIAAANLALYKMMITKDNTVKTAVINSLQAINMRRYWPQELQNGTLGCHISMLDVSIPANRENFERFWDYVRAVHSSLLHQLEKTRHPLIVMPISERLQILICSNSLLNRLRLPSTNDNHYCVTNMGDLADAFPGTGPEVEVKRVLRTASCHLMSYLCQHTIHTFRGRFSYSLDYYTQKMSKETASAYSQCILDLLKSCVESPV